MTSILRALAILFVPTAAFSAPKSGCPFVYIDLGQTLVDTATNNYNPMFYLKVDAAYTDHDRFPSGKEYVDAVSQSGLPLGMIVDVPEAWGSPQDPPLEEIRDYMTAKFLRTQEFLLGLHPSDQSGFTGTPFDWSPFAGYSGLGPDRLMTGHLFLPKTTAERKRTGSTVLFERALAAARADGCNSALYLGEDEAEMALAEKSGLTTFWVGHTSRDFFLPPEKVADYIDFSGRPRDPARGPYWRGPY